jgi:hypothetical protein
LAKFNPKKEAKLVKFTLEKKKKNSKKLQKSSKISPEELKTLNWTKEAYLCP